MKRFLILLIALFIMQTIIGYNAMASDIVWTKNTHYIKYVQFSPDSKLIATNNDGQVLIHDVETQETLFEYNPILQTRFTPDGKYLVGYFNTNELIVIDVATWQRRTDIQLAPSNISAYDISKDGKKIIAAYTLKYEYSIWDIESGQIERTVRFPIEDSANSKWAYMLDIYYGKDDKAVLFTTTRAIPDIKPPFYKSIISTHLVDANSQVEIHRMDVAGRIMTVSGGKNFFVHKKANDNNTAFKVINLHSWEEALVVPGISNSVNSYDFSPDENFAVAGYGVGVNKITVYEISSGKETYTYKYGTLDIIDVSKDGKFIAAGNGERLHLLNAHFGSTEIRQPETVTGFRTFPNPTNTNSINIEFYLILPGITRIQLYDLTGRIVRNIENSFLNSGQHKFEIDLSNLMNGQYNLTFETLHGSVNHKILVNR